MSELFQTLAISASGMRAQASRIRFQSENIANADTPGYHRKMASFKEIIEHGTHTGQVETGPVTLDQRKLTQVFDPGHPLADETGHYDGSNVNLVVEIADAREAQRSYEANLKMFEQAQQMSKSVLELLRR